MIEAADDEVTQASGSDNREFVAATMEREIRNISEIEQAFERIARKEYGVCVTCEKTIPDNRLQAIPWTRRCVDCAGGGIKSSSGPPLGLPAFGSRWACGMVIIHVYECLKDLNSRCPRLSRHKRRVSCITQLGDGRWFW